jgi:hypothetical protein
MGNVSSDIGNGRSRWRESDMTRQRSRAYKLQLSIQGIQLFLRCHCRFCRIVGDLMPYGATLFVASALLHRSPPEDFPGCLVEPDLNRYAGRLIRYVGTSPALSDLVHELSLRADRSGLVDRPPQIWRIFNAALAYMEDVTDRAVLDMFDEIGHELGRPRGSAGDRAGKGAT